LYKKVNDREYREVWQEMLLPNVDESED